MRGQPPPGDSGMEKAFSNQLWAGDSQLGPAQNPQASSVLGALGVIPTVVPHQPHQGFRLLDWHGKGVPGRHISLTQSHAATGGPQQLTVTCSPTCLLTSITQGQPGGGVTYLLVPGPALGMFCSFLLGSVRVPYTRSA